MSQAQLAAILRDLDRHRICFDLTEAGTGDHALDIAVDGVKRCFAMQEDPDGGIWPALSPQYAAEKARDSPGVGIGVRLALMSAEEQVRGVRVVEAHRATMTYGTGDEARAEAEWFQDPQHANQPPRGFYGLHVDAVPAIDAHFDARFAWAIPR